MRRPLTENQATDFRSALHWPSWTNALASSLLRCCPFRWVPIVSLPNSDDVRHHVYSFSFPNNFELKLYHGEQNKPISFDDAGVVVLVCNIHDGMLGYLQVVDTPWFAKTELDGLASVDQNPPGDYTLQVWHPDLGMSYERQSLTLTEGHQVITVKLPASSPSTSPRQQPALCKPCSKTEPTHAQIFLQAHPAIDRWSCRRSSADDFPCPAEHSRQGCQGGYPSTAQVSQTPVVFAAMRKPEHRSDGGHATLPGH